VSDQAVTNLAAAVVDGDTIDWAAATSRLSSSEDLSVARQLRTLSDLRAAQSSDSPAVASRRLPWLLESVRLVAVVCCAVGSAGFLGALRSANGGRLLVLATVLATFAGTAAVLDIGGRDRRARALGVCYWTIAASFAARGIFILAQVRPASRVLALALALRPEALFPAALWQFARDFPAITRFSRVDRLCAWAIPFVTIIGAALFAVNIAPVPPDVSPFHTAMLALQRLNGFGAWFWNVVFGAALPALGVIAWRARLATGEEGRRVRFFLAAIAIAIGPVVLEVIGEGLFPSFARAMQTPRGHAVGAWIIYPPMFLFPAATAYAVAVDHVLAVRVVIQRALRYLLARWLIMWGGAVPVVLLVGYLRAHANQPLADVLATRQAQLLMWSASVAVILLVCRPALLRVLDRWALPDSEVPSAGLAHLSDGLKRARTPLEVTALLARAVERAVQASAHPYLLREGTLVPVRGDVPPPPSASLIPVLLDGSREPCTVSIRERHSYFKLMTEEDRKWIADRRIAVLVPVAPGRGGGPLLGVIALEDRRNALSYTGDDIRFLRAGAAAASLACDVARSEHRSETAPDTVEEVASECTQCGRVDTWQAAGERCACGGAWQAAALPRHLMSRFEVRQRLGKGGMGVVYLATDLVLGREDAIKTLPRLAERPAARLLAEAKTMATLSHAHIAVLYETMLWRGTPILVMEFMRGGTLGDRLRRGPVSCRASIELVTQLATALVQLHRSELYHGDVKPSNIGFTAEGVPKFLDFGLARAIQQDSGDGGSGAVAVHESFGGTFAYLSPEVRDGTAPGPSLDLWALAVVLCECVMGHHPFMEARTAADFNHLSRQMLDELHVHEASHLREFLSVALAPEPSLRPRSAAEMVDALARL
jgi:hypothetical protein